MKPVITIAAAAIAVAGVAVPASAAPAATPRATCLNAADAARWAGHLASLERARDAKLAARADAVGDKRLATEATAAAAGLGPLIFDINQRVIKAGEYLDNGFYGKCAALLKPWVR